MKTFDLQGITIEVSYEKAFRYIAEPANLPDWTSAFKSASNGVARLETPAGEVDIRLQVNHSFEHGTIDWIMTFPDEATAFACSRILKAGDGLSIFTFVLMPPPVPLEQLEGTLEKQSQILQEELIRLRKILEKRE